MVAVPVGTLWLPVAPAGAILNGCNFGSTRTHPEGPSQLQVNCTFGNLATSRSQTIEDLPAGRVARPCRRVGHGLYRDRPGSPDHMAFVRAVNDLGSGVSTTGTAYLSGGKGSSPYSGTCSTNFAAAITDLPCR